MMLRSLPAVTPVDVGVVEVFSCGYWVNVFAWTRLFFNVSDLQAHHVVEEKPLVLLWVLLTQKNTQIT